VIASTLRKAGRIAYLAVAIPASLLALSSYFAYTTAGLDFEIPTEEGIDTTYYRLRWDDGSTWVGFAIQPCPRPRRPLDWFDPGGTLLVAPTRPEHRTWSNDLGFWWVDDPAEDPYVPTRYPGARVSRWWAMPSWMVLLGLWFRPLRRGLGRLGRPASTRRVPDPIV
jgi:hypothetical protein